MPKKEIRKIQIEMGNGSLSTEQYEFICARLIDSMKQKEEYNNDFLKLLRTQVSINDVIELINKRLEAEKEGKRFEW